MLERRPGPGIGDRLETSPLPCKQAETHSAWAPPKATFYELFQIAMENFYLNHSFMFNLTCESGPVERGKKGIFVET